MTIPTPPSSGEHFERRDRARRDEIEASGGMRLSDKVALEEDSYGGVLGSIAFPMTLGFAAILLTAIISTIFVDLGLHNKPEQFVLVCSGIAALVVAPLSVAVHFREQRKWRSHQALRAVAAVDPLTGLLNRRSFSASLDEELQRMFRTGHSAAIILFDLDRFKHLNDSFGHHVGDEVLTKIAAIAYAELRSPFDRLARWGGEEFIILLHNMTEETAKGVCERLRSKIEELVVEHRAQEVAFTASFGGSLLHPNQPFEDALNRADKALYLAKTNGRNRVEFKRHLSLAS